MSLYSPPPFEIEPSELAAALHLVEAGRLRLIDCRESEEFSICRLERAELLPMSQFPEMVGQLGEDQSIPLVVYCHHGMRSARATEYLRSLGFHQARSLAGGIDRWSCEIDETIPRY